MDDQTDLPICYIGNGAAVVCALSVTNGDLVAVFQAQDLGVIGILSRQHHEAFTDLLF